MPMLRVQLVSEDGTPLKGVRGTVTRVEMSDDGRIIGNAGEPYRVKRSDENGMINLIGREMVGDDAPMEWQVTDAIRGSYGYHVAFEGKKSLPTKVAARYGSFPQRVVVRGPVEIFFRLDGETVAGKPKVAPATEIASALTKNPKSSIKLKKVGRDLWKADLIKGEQYVVGWIGGKNLFGYLTPVFRANAGLEVPLTPGEPATLEYVMSEIPSDIDAVPAKIALRRKVETGAEPQYIDVPWKLLPADSATTYTITNVAAGTYELSAVHYSPFGATLPFPYLRDRRDITLRPGTTNVVVAEYPVRDETIEEGDVVIKGTLFRAGGAALGDRTIQLRPFDEKGPVFERYYPETKTDFEGQFEFAGVSPLYNYTLQSPDAAGTSVQVVISAETFKESKTVDVAMVQGAPRIEFSPLAPVPEMAVDYADGKPGLLSELKGNTVLVMFWAGWHVPSRRALTRLNDYAAIPKSKDNLVVMAVNLDAERNSWMRMIKDTPTPALRHAQFSHRRNMFRVQEALPYFVLVDEYGTVRRAGAFDVDEELLKMGYREKEKEPVKPPARRQIPDTP